MTGVVSAAATNELVVIASVDGRLRVLDAVTLQPSGLEFPGVTAVTDQIAVSADGSRMLIVLADGTARLGDLATRTFLGGPIDVAVFETPRKPYWVTHTAALRSDGDEVAVGTAHGVVVWELAAERLVAHACRLAGRDLTRAEWDGYIGDLAARTDLCGDFGASDVEEA